MHTFVLSSALTWVCCYVCTASACKVALKCPIMPNVSSLVMSGCNRFLVNLSAYCVQKIVTHNGQSAVCVNTDKSFAIKIAPPTAQGQEAYTTCAIIGAQVIAAPPTNAVSGIPQLIRHLVDRGKHHTSTAGD